MKKFTIAKVTVDCANPASQVFGVICLALAAVLCFSGNLWAVTFSAPLLYMSIATLSKAKLLDGQCPYCETNLQAMSIWLRMNCPACNQRIVIRGNKLHTLGDKYSNYDR